jgi:hypothetical protein
MTLIERLLAQANKEANELADLLNEAAQALAQPQREPVARIDSPVTPLDWGLFRAEITLTTRLPQFSDLYTSPPARKPLTDQEINYLGYGVSPLTRKSFARAIEAAHGIKETK